MTVTAFSIMDRARALEGLADTTFDLVIVGGGINGAGIARDASLRGMKVALFEKGDFASGTSSRSSKLVHGGVRYLEHYQFGLVHEASVERRTLLNIAPHLVKPLGFLMPVFRGARYGPFFVNLGLWLYDGLAMFRNVQMHRGLRTRDFEKLAPGLRTSDLLGGSLFYDAQTNDARLTLETLRAAHAAGATALNYAAVSAFVRDGLKIRGVRVKDGITGAELDVKARVFVNAAGPWSDLVRRQLDGKAPDVLRITKGVHILLPPGKKDLVHAVVLISPIDGRVLFAIPWEDMLLVGTTDTDFEGDFDHVSADADEVDYLLRTLMSYFPGLELSRSDVVGSFAGLRPLLGGGDGQSESQVSREHKILEEPSGLLTLVGGKLTTYRKMSEQVVDRVADKLRSEHGLPVRTPCRTSKLVLRSFCPPVDRAAVSALAAGLPAEAVQRVAERYPGEEAVLLQAMREQPLLAEKVTARSPYLNVEIHFACKHEMAANLTDLMVRRLTLFYREPDQGLQAARTVAKIAGAALGWPEAEIGRQLAAYEKVVGVSRRFRGGA